MAARPPFKKKELPIRPPFKKKEPLTIMKIKPPIAERRKGKPVPPLPPKPINWTPLLPKPIKPAPRRSPTLKWNIKKR